MPLLRVQYAPNNAVRNPLAIEYLTPGEDYYMRYSANWKPHRWLGHTTQFTSAERTSGTFIDTYKVQQRWSWVSSSSNAVSRALHISAKEQHHAYRRTRSYTTPGNPSPRIFQHSHLPIPISLGRPMAMGMDRRQRN